MLKVYLRSNSSNTSEISSKIEDFLKEYINKETQEECMTFSRNTFLRLIIENIDEIKSAMFLYPLTDLKAAVSEIFSFGSVDVEYVQDNDEVGA